MKTKKTKIGKSAFISMLTALALILCIGACGNSGSKNTASENTENADDPKESKSNGVFEIMTYGKDSVQFKAAAETKFYAIALISGDEVYEGKSFSNTADTVRWSNGSRFWPGSSMSMPAVFGVGAMTLPEGIIMTISGFGTPDSFSPSKIRFTTEGETEMYYNISKKSWDK